MRHYINKNLTVSWQKNGCYNMAYCHLMLQKKSMIELREKKVKENDFSIYVSDSNTKYANKFNFLIKILRS